MKYKTVILWSVGLFSGFLSGFFGIGGGIFIVPALTLLLKYPIKKAIACSFAAIIVFATVGTFVHIIKGSDINWQIVLFCALGAIPAAKLGVKLRTLFSDIWLNRVFAFVILLASIRMLISTDFSDIAIIPQGEYFWYLIVGAASGMLAAIVGIGGGVIMIPAMLFFGNVAMSSASPTSLAITVFICLSTIIFQKKLKMGDIKTSANLMVSGVIAVLIGIFLMHLLSVESPELLTKLFGVLLILVCIRMLLNLRPKKQLNNVNEQSVQPENLMNQQENFKG
jgi:uncharacterized membrane protein YfcA